MRGSAMCAGALPAPRIIDLAWKREVEPGHVLELALPLVRAAEGYRAMSDRRALKALLHPEARSRR